MNKIVELKLPARIRKRGLWFISSCPALDVLSQGETRSIAKRNLIDALTTFLVSCYERGTLNAILRDAGLKPSDSAKGASSGSITVRIPFVRSRRKARS